MIYADELLFVVELVLVVYCVLNVITTPEGEVRNLPKLLWLALVIILPIVGGVAWLVAGRPVTNAAGLPYKGNRGLPATYRRPGRAVAASPDDDEDFLRALRERTDRQREEARRQREREQGTDPDA